MSSFDRRQLTRVNVSDPGDEIVISGISGRFPKSRNVAELTFNLFNKVDMVDVNETRFKNINDELPERYGLTVDIDKFDSTFFSINRRQAQNLDPQQRILQEHAYEAVMDSGMCPKQLRGSRTGVFVGCGMAEIEEYLLFSNATKDGSGMLGSARSLLSNRISFAMDFKGPSLQVDTACSSAGYALDLAFNAIRNGECEAAIVGASNLIINESSSLQFARLGVLARDGICRAFDEKAHGYVRAESVSTLFLQKRKDAKRIYAHLVYSKTNVDGFKNEGLTFPSSDLQIKLFRELYHDIGINPLDVDFVEAHSTATRVGDPEECNSIDQVFCTDRVGPLLVGSIKSNMGHTEASASNSALIKSILMFENGKIPPNLHLTQVRQDIPSLVSGRIKPVTEIEDFNGSLVAVNSFGFGGANSHILVRKNSKLKINRGIPSDNLPRLLVWSGRTEEALNKIFDSVLKQPLDAEYIALLQHTQNATQSSNTYRGYAIYSQEAEAENATCIERHIDNFAEAKRPVVWVYSGMGSQWVGMGADLMKIPIFEESIKECHNILAKKGIDLIKIVTSDDPTIFNNILHSFVGISAVQIGLTNVLKAVGLEPDYIIGHSFGELGCAYADNCLSTEEMILASYSRGLTSIMNKTIFGSMAAVGVGYKELKSMLDDGIEIACHNSSDSCTISGPSEIVAQFVEKLKKQDYFAKEVQCSNIAYHSSYIADLGPDLLQSLKPLITIPKYRSTKWISTSVPKSNWDSIQCRYSSAQYHTNNLLNPVLFEEGCENLPKNALTIEIAPHGLLQAIMKRTLPDGMHFSLTKRGNSESSMLLYNALGRLFENGVDLDLSKLYPPIEFPVSRGTPMIAPNIGWDHSETYYVPLFIDKQCNEHLVNVNLSDPEFEFISGHEIDGRILFPATGYLFLAWKLMAAQCLENFKTFDVEFEDIKFIRACNIQKDQEQKLTVLLHRGNGHFEISEGSNTLVTGTVRPCTNYKLTDIDDEESNENVLELESADFYKELRLRGYHYKNLFRSVVSAKMDSSSAKLKWQSNWVAFLDCLLQVQIVSKDSRSLALPIGIKKIVIKRNEHEKLMSELGENPIVEVKYSSDLNLLRCGGVEIRGLLAQTVGRRPPKGIPVLESHQFIPHFPTYCLSKTDIGRFCVQLAIENYQFGKVSCIEIDMNDEMEPLSEYFGLALGDLPLVTSEMKYLTSREIEIPQTTVSNVELSEFSNQTFVIKSNCLFDAEFMNNVTKYISDNGYIISRESKDFEIIKDYDPQGFKIVAVISSEDETLIMIQYNKVPPAAPSNIIRITNEDRNYAWLETLKEKAKTEPTLIYAENESASGILGLVNCIRKEPSGSNLRCVFIDDESAPPFDLENPFYKLQLEKGLAINVFRNGEWGSFKHFLIKPFYEKLPYEDSCYANGLVRGDLSSIKWLQSPIMESSDSIVNVQYAALNFRDVMLATGKLAAETMGDNRMDLLCLMGLEFAGITKGGRRVMGMKASGAMATHIEADDIFAWDIPEDWSLEQAVTVPCVYGTVYAAFFITTKIEKGNSILIHAGCGGVGLAAIRVAFAYGLEVFTTVSTEEKRNFLLNEFPQLKRENIGNSRDTSFEDLIMKRTRGKGVDYVLNSLAEEKLAASVRCLGKGGKFLEIGKYDMANDNKLSLGDFLRELTFHAVLVDNMFKAPKEKKLFLKNLLDDDMKKGIIKPLNTNLFNADEIENAFRLLASGKHIGKVVLKIRENENDSATLPISVLPRIYCNPNYSYVICGGLGGFGLELADWLIIRGCRNIVLSTSRGITKQYQAYRIKLWESYGVNVEVNKSDITTREGCEQLINDALKIGAVGGIFNLALQLRDSILENQNVSTFEQCMAPKAYATKYLDEISRVKCPFLQYFVIFSSVSCGRGNAGQSNYGMANSVMERIVEVRHNLRLPAKAIQWGAVGEVGIVADMQEDKIDMEIGGTLLQRISSCLEELDTLLTVDNPIVASMVVAEKRYKGSGKGGVIEMLMNIMSIKDIKTLSLETKLSELGMDSLMTVEISQTLEREFNIIVSPQELRSMTVQQLKDLETNGTNAVPETPVNGLEFLIRNLGVEATSHLTILKLNDKLDDECMKALVFPGVEGVCGQIFYDLADQLKYPTYLLQNTNIWNISDINEMCSALSEDVAKLYENDSTFLLIGYSYGAILTLKLAKMLEDLGKTGKVILIDGSPESSKKMLNESIPETDNVEELVEGIVLEVSLNYAFPNDNMSDRRKIALSERTWDGKWKKLEELYHDFELYSKDHCYKISTLMKNRVMAGYKLSLEDFPILDSEIQLVKPTSPIVTNIDNDFGLKKYSKHDIQMTVIDGNHSTVLQNVDLANLINSAF